jgi:outer membrane protein assembly factor BamB
MKTICHFLIVIAVATFISAACLQASEPAQNWPAFRGTQASGVLEGHALPERWDAGKGESVRWKTAIPGLGHSSPVIWGDRVFVTTAVREGDAELKVGLYGDIGSVTESLDHRWMLYCLDKKTGAILWERAVHQGVPIMKRHPKSSHANSTPATDGKHIVTFFGSEGLFCHDFEGNLLWRKDFGPLDSGYFLSPTAQWGFASSPVIHGNVVLVQCDVQTNSFLAALDLRDGTELWRTSREEVPTWSTPTVHAGPGRAQVILNGYKHIGAYDLKNGAELWKLRGGGDIPVPTPIIGHGLVFIMNAHGKMAPIYAIRLDAAGDISLEDGASENKGVAWSKTRGGNYMQTPILYGEYLYACSDSGILACYDARTGEQFFRERLGKGGSGYTASPVGGDGKLYYTSEQGTVFVVKPGREFNVIATNEMGELCMATPAISEGTLFFRTRNHLVAIGKGPNQ